MSNSPFYFKRMLERFTHKVNTTVLHFKKVSCFMDKSKGAFLKKNFSLLFIYTLTSKKKKHFNHKKVEQVVLYLSFTLSPSKKKENSVWHQHI